MLLPAIAVLLVLLILASAGLLILKERSAAKRQNGIMDLQSPSESVEDTLRPTISYDPRITHDAGVEVRVNGQLDEEASELNAASRTNLIQTPKESVIHSLEKPDSDPVNAKTEPEEAGKGEEAGNAGKEGAGS